MKAAVIFLALIPAFQLSIGANHGQMELTTGLTSDTSTQSKLQLSLEDREWCTVIESARAKAESFEPDTRAILLSKVAAGLKKCSPSEVPSVLERQFIATLDLQSDSKKEVAREIQTWALGDLLLINREKAKSWLPKAEPEVRARIRGSLIAAAIQDKQLDQAVEQLKQVPSDEEFQYIGATQLMLALPLVRKSEKDQILALAIERYGLRREDCIGCADLSYMIQQAWHEVSPDLVLEGIHRVFELDTDDNSPFAYRYHASQLVPVLAKLDRHEADRIVKNLPAQAQLDFGASVSHSSSTSSREGPPNRQTGGEEAPVSENWASRKEVSASARLEQIYQNRVAELARLAETNPQRAITDAAALPSVVHTPRSEAIWASSHLWVGLLTPRARALLQVARTTQKESPSAARRALEELGKSLDDLAPSTQLNFLLDGMSVAAEIDARELAEKLLQHGIQQLEKIKADDTDPDDPNLAPKAWWPSVAVASNLVLAAASYISPKAALSAIDEMNDPELGELIRVTLANKQLGISERSMTMVRKRHLQSTSSGEPLQTSEPRY